MGRACRSRPQHRRRTRNCATTRALPVLPRFKPLPSLTVVRWVVQEGWLFSAIVSSGAGFYSGPICSSMLVAGHLRGLAPGGPGDFTAHSHLELFALGLLS